MSKHIDFNDLLPKIGDYGRYQLRLQIIFILLSTSAMHQLIYNYYLSDDTLWRCKANSTTCIGSHTRSTQDRKYCSQPVTEWEFVNDGRLSVEQTYHLYCEKKWMMHLSTSVHWLGYVVGIPIISWISDRYGRRSTIASTMTLMNGFGLMLSFAPNIEVFCLLRFLAGLCVGGFIQMFILLQEVVGNHKRNIAGMAFWINVQLSAVLLTLTAYFLRNWKIFNIASTAPFLVFGLFHIIIPESPRWCLLNNKKDQALQIARQIGKLNNREVPDDIELNIVAEEIDTSPLKVFKNKKQLFYMTALSIGYFISCIGYYGMTLASGDLPGSKYVNFLLLNLSEIPACLLAVYTGDRFGRKLTIVPTLILGGLFGICTAFTPSVGQFGIVRRVMGVSGKFCITMAYLMQWTWSVEVYPTDIRILAVAVNHFCGKIGGITIPWVSKHLFIVHYSLPFLVMGSMCIGGAVLLCWVPETKGKNLVDLTENGKKKGEEDFALITES